MSDDQCTEVCGRNGEPLRQCRLTAGHGGGHSDGALTWLLGSEPTVTPLQERGPEGPAQWCGDGGAPVGGPCSMALGHEGNHQNGRHIWRQAQENYRSTNLAGAKHDDLIRDLFRRVETLEQLARPTASCASEELRQGLGEVEKRMTRLEQAQVYGPGPHDLSVLQASIANHVNQALAEFGSQLGVLLDGMRGMLAQHISTNTAAVLARLEPEPEQARCGEPDHSGLYSCELEPGHAVRHANGLSSWPLKCDAIDPRSDGKDPGLCVRVRGHRGPHTTDPRERSMSARWNDPEPVTHVEPGLDYTTERASGSPAAVRCPAQFREGQCLGYAGHEGECSALPDPREPQLENPEEFGHTSYASLNYLNRRDVPDQSGGPFVESTHDRTTDGTPIEPGDPFEGDGHGDTSHSV